MLATNIKELKQKKDEKDKKVEKFTLKKSAVKGTHVFTPKGYGVIQEEKQNAERGNANVKERNMQNAKRKNARRKHET